MQWSKLRSLIESRFAESLGKRVSIHSTAYGNCSCGHAWITLDGDVIANFCTRAHYLKLADERAGRQTPASSTKKHEAQFVEYGEMSRQDAYQSCWRFIHELSIEQALSDSDPLVMSLAVLDQRLGKRRIQSLALEPLHSLPRHLLEIRAAAEGIALPARSNP
ncbi:SF0329 family protein [Geothrix terrae]|uniref:SF0329 family protein n=1 Tax=Geothrix TaxID=44675 RepID=UPI003B8489F1